MHEVYDELVRSGMIDTIALNTVKSVDQMELKQVADIVEKIYEKVCEGDFVGQYQDFIYVQDIAEILQCSFETVLRAVETVLTPERRLSLNGFILADYKESEDQREMMYKATGHKDIYVSDFGYWVCRDCGKNGDDWDDPRSKKCS